MSTMVVGDLVAYLDVDDTKFKRKVDSAGKDYRKLGDSLTRTGGIMSATLTPAMLGGFALAVKGASDLSESMNKIDVVFGKNAGSVKKWSEDSATAMGQSRQQALEAAGTFGNLFVSLGLTSDKSTEMSTSLVALAGDLASFNNVSPDEALQALQSGLVGETEPMRKFGVNMDDATMRQEAFQMGLMKSTKEVLPPAVKAQVAYALIMKQTGTAQGDFKRTADGVANSSRIVAAEVKDLAASMGDVLLPVIKPVFEELGKGLDVVNGMPGALKGVVVGVGLLVAAMGPLLVITGSVLKGFQTIRDFRFRKTVPTSVSGGAGGVAGAAGGAGVTELGSAAGTAAIEVANLGRSAAIASGGGLSPAGKRGAGLMNQGVAAQSTKNIEKMGNTAANRVAPQLSTMGQYAKGSGGKLSTLNTTLGNSTTGTIAATIGLGLALDFTVPKVLEAGSAFLEWMKAGADVAKYRSDAEGNEKTYLQKIADKYGANSPEYWKAYNSMRETSKKALGTHAGRGGGGPQAQAYGGKHVVTKPTLFLAGENGTEEAEFRPFKGGGQSNATGGINLTVKVGVSASFMDMPTEAQIDALSRKIATPVGDIIVDRIYAAGGG